MAYSRPIAVFCDFDGTVTTTDVTDLLLEQLADPAWQEIEQRWVKGEIDDCQCMAEQIALISASWEKIAQVMDGITIDPYFKSFMALCNQSKIPVYIGSNGLDRVITYILDRENIKIDGYWAYKLVESNNSWSLSFPHDENREGCKTRQSIACKCVLLSNELGSNFANTHKIVIGDSKSDYCWSHKADFVFAKTKLAEYCRANKIAHEPFADFAQIIEYLEQNVLVSK